jgi:hypothetical protein
MVPGLRPDPGNRVLGLGMLALAGGDLLTWRARRPRHWWFVHMRHMLSSFALALVAFSGAALKILPENLRYWWPIVVGVSSIVGWTSYFRVRREL